MNARYMDPETGIFITPDPAMDGLNHYAYCSSNPIRYIDPTGLYYYDDYNYNSYSYTSSENTTTTGTRVSGGSQYNTLSSAQGKY